MVDDRRKGGNDSRFPATWVESTIGDVYSLFYGKGLTRSARNANGRYPVYGSSGIVGYHDDYLVEGPAIVIGRKGAAGSVLFSQESCWPIDTTYYLRSSQHIELKFSYYFLLSQRLCRLEKSTAIPGLGRDDAYSVSIRIPPLNEQRCIVAKIEELFSELDKGVESLRTAREQLKVYRQAVLKHAFEGKLTAQWREENAAKLESPEQRLARIQQDREARYQRQIAEWEAAVATWETKGKEGKKPRSPKAMKPLSPIAVKELSGLPVLPSGWIYMRAEDIAGFITKGTTPRKDLLYSGSGAIPFVKVYNLTKTGFLDFSVDPTFVSLETHNGFLARSKVYPGDVLMNIVGPPLGKVSIVPDSYPEWNINQAIAIYRSSVVSSQFMAAYLSSESAVRAMIKKSKATAGQFNLTLEVCRDVLIPVASEAEQREVESLIASKMSEIDHVDQTITASLERADALRQSILKKAFSGQLVPQDLNDEPASTLLERIKAGKAGQAKPGKVKGRRQLIGEGEERA